MVSKLLNSNIASSSGSGTLPGNTITNPKEDLKGITTRSGVAYQGPTIPTPSKVVKQGTDVTKGQVQTPSSQSTSPVQPPVAQSETPVSKPVVAPVSASMPNLKPSIPYPLRRDNERRRDQANEQIEKFYENFKDMSFKISFADALILMPKFASTLKALIGNKEKLSKMARTLMNEHCSAVILNKLPKKLGDPGKFLIPCEFPGMDECLALADLGASINLRPLSVWEELSLPELTPTCMTLELEDRLVSKPIGIAKVVSVKVGVFHFPTDFVVVDFEPGLRVLLILRRCFLKTGRALIDVHKEVLDFFFDVIVSGSPTPSDDLIVSTTSPTLTPFGDSDFQLFEEADTFLGLEDDPDLPEFDPSYYDPEGDILLLEAILNSKLSPPLPNHEQSVPSFKKELKFCEAKTIKSFVDEPPEVELKDLLPHLKYGIISEFCTHKILMEEDYKPTVQQQRRVNPKIHDVIKKEVEKLLDAGLIYPISDSPWVSPRSTFSKFATMDPRGDIMVLTSPPKRSLMSNSFGPPLTRMLTSLSKTVTRANDKEKFHNVMRCLKISSKFVKSLTFGALTLWARSRLHEGTNIFSWPSIICRNELKRKRSSPMTPELFASSLNLSSLDLVPLELS
uniref:Reverse transcriptase domain-containing protein n=1 Tax=Tanacetum cinerariifolium TaxID=118510 RepID=A0A6L2NRN6_TANCI|nr:reverse transcriptase domain-containing protein [Tanacetum cinerariifolium]